jgi:hypothetical protein
MAARVLLVSQNLKGSELAESLTKEHNLVLKCELSFHLLTSAKISYIMTRALLG